jgi:hypothetical protein
MSKFSRHLWLAVFLLLIVAASCFIAARDFLSARTDERLYPSANLSKWCRLSDYVPELRNSHCDTDVYIFEGVEPGATLVILGGTHPNEPAGFFAACTILENVHIQKGRLIVIPRANHSAFTCTDPGEGNPSCLTINTPNGTRRFRLGSRYTNPLDQWPDPEIYLHYPSKQELSGGETRNLNRSFPGRLNGNATERAALGILTLIAREKADLVIDLHEASPEYPVINAIVMHERATDVAATANLQLQAAGLEFALEPSPKNLRGLTHREIGDATSAQVVLMESANLMQGRLRGRTSAEKLISGQDACYLAAARAGLLRVPYDSTGIPLRVRVRRHLAGVRALSETFSSLNPDRPLELVGLPSYDELQAHDIGFYLQPKSKIP